jgi:ATP-dependent RNA helicase A
MLDKNKRFFSFLQAEETDANSEIHGNWTIENAKSRLHGFLQQFKINTDYKYTATGQDNAK